MNNAGRVCDRGKSGPNADTIVEAKYMLEKYAHDGQLFRDGIED